METKKSIKTIETIDGNILEIPQTGVVSGVIVDNLPAVIEQFSRNRRWLNYDRGVFEILHYLEECVRGSKTRKIDPVILSPYKGKKGEGSDGDVIFNLIGFEKERDFEGEERYLAIYTFSSTVS